MDENHPLNPYTTYAASKLAGEAYVRSFHNCYGMDYTLIRPFNAYGPRHRTDSYCAVIFRFLERYLSNRQPIIYGDGNQTRDLTYVKDSAKGIVLAGESEKLVNEAVNIGTGNEISVNEIAAVVGEVLGKDVKPAFAKERPGDVSRHCADISKAQKKISFTPKYSFREGIEETVEWYSRNARASGEKEPGA